MPSKSLNVLRLEDIKTACEALSINLTELQVEVLGAALEKKRIKDFAVAKDLPTLQEVLS